MDTMDNDSAALEQILGDMDGMEGKRVYGDKPEQSANSGVSITIDVAPKGMDEKKEDPKLDAPPMPAEDESGMPPFLRKRS